MAQTIANLYQLSLVDAVTWGGLHTFSAGLTMSGSALTLSSVGGGVVAPLKFVTSTAPSAPVTGQMWFDGTDLFFRKSGTTITMSSGGSVSSIVAGTGLTGGTITSTGTLSVDQSFSPTWSGTHTFNNAIVFASAQTFNAGKLTIPSQAIGDILYASSVSAWSRLGIGSTGQALVVAGGVPTWAGVGTVTSIVAGTGLTGGTITATGTLAVDQAFSPTWSGTHTFSNAITFASAQTFNAANLTIGSQATGDILYASSSSVWSRLAIGSTNKIQKVIGGLPSWQDDIVAITAGFAGGGVPLTASTQCDVFVPYSGTIVSVTLLADVSGSVVVDIWKVPYASYPATISNTITASALPTITTATNSQDNTLTGWTTSISAGDCLRFNINSATSITRLTLVLKVKKGV